MLRASFQNSNTTDKFGIPNFKAVVAASPVSNRASQQSKYTPTKSPASDWSPVKFLPVCSPDVQGLTRNTTASQTPLGKNTPVKKSAGFTSPVKKGQQALGGQKPAEEDYMSAVWKKMVEKNQAECPDQAQIPNVIEYLHLEPRSPGKSPVRKNVVANRVKSPQRNVNERSGGLKGQKLGQYAGKESIDDLVRASKVTESGSTKSLRDMVEKAKLTSKEEDSDVNVVEKYIGKTKGKESSYKTPRHRDEGLSKNYGLFTPENYMGASRTQTEASNHESVLYTDRQSASKGVLDLSVSRSKVNDPGYSRVNRPSYDETVWTSPRRSQLVEIGNSPKGEKRVEVVLRDGVEKYKQALATSMENFEKMEEELAKKQARKYVEKHVEEQVSEVEKQIEEGDKEIEQEQEQEQKQEQEKEKENRCEEEEEEEEEEKEENKDNEKEKEEENGCGENCEEEEEVQELKEETLVEDKEEFVRTVEREVEFAREPEREQRKKQAYPQHVVERHEIFSIPENEKAEQESSQSEEAEQHNGEEISEEQREKKEEVTSDGVKSTKGSQEIVSNVMETPTGTGDDLTRQPESETQNDTTEEDIAENVLTVYQEKMAKVETWKKLGDQENQISLLKEVIQDLEDYEAGHVKGHAEEERKNVITHKIYAHNRLAAEFYEAGEYEKALQSCRKVAEIDSTNLQALNKACQIHTKLGNTEKSKDIMKRIRKLMQTPMILQYNQQFLLGEIAMNSQTGSQGASSQGDMLASKLSFFNH